MTDAKRARLAEMAQAIDMAMKDKPNSRVGNDMRWLTKELRAAWKRESIYFETLKKVKGWNYGYMVKAAFKKASEAK